MGLKVLGIMLAGILLLTQTGPVQAAEVDSFRVSQVCAIHPNFYAFLEILDADGNMRMDVQKDQISAVLGTEPLTIENFSEFNPEQGVAYILLVDVSKSLSGKEFAAMRQVLLGWINDMGPKDQAAIITFGTQVKTLQDFSTDKGLLTGIINQLRLTDNDTQLHKGLIKAMELGSRADSGLPARRVIITLSDGQDDYAGGATPKEVYDMMKTDPVPIYAIGYYRAPRKPQKEEALKSLGAFARTSGGSYFRGESNTIPEMFNLMHQRIINVYQVKFLWPEGKWDGAPRFIQVTYKEGPKVLNAGLDMRLQTSDKAVAASTGDLWGKMYPWGYVGGGVLLLTIIIVAIVVSSSQKGERLPLQEPLTGGGAEMSDTNAPATVQMRPVQPVTPVKTKAPAGNGKMLRLTPIRSDEEHTPYEVNLTDRLVIGRSPNCDVALTEDKEVSRNHCELTLEDEVVKITDLGSKNGTLVNGVPISGDHILNNDDIILVGRTELRVMLI